MTDSAFNKSSELVSVTQTAKLLGITRQRVHDDAPVRIDDMLNTIACVA
ncbi:MAG: hypothetical protein V7K64_02585 [Nostoc sp.]